MRSDRRAAATVVAGRVPALDGLRGVAVVAVLLFHLGYAQFSGGYLGVSLFFTLSGYLITTRALEELRSSGDFGVGAFFMRRVRRLLPAQLLTVLLVGVLAVVVPHYPRDGVRADALWSLGQVFNWRAIAEGRQYADLFGQPSPFDHFWSLAVEEQFYVAAAVCFAVLARHRRGAITGLTAAFVGLSVLTVVLGPRLDPNLVYLGTPFRAPEILAGVCLAFVLRDGSRALRQGPALGAGAMVVFLAAVVATGASSAAWPYRGLLPLFALCSVALVVSAVSPDLPGVGRALSTRVVGWLGRRSYGIYLFHWPIFLVPVSADVPGWMVDAAKVACTLMLAELSFRLLEEPVRTRAMPMVVRRSLLVSWVVLLVVAGVAVRSAARTVTQGDQIDQEQAEQVEIRPETTGRTTDGAGTEVSSPGVVAAGALDVLLIGDSTAAALGGGLVESAVGSDVRRVSVKANGACGLVRGGRYADEVLDSALQMACPSLVWGDAIDTARQADPDVVVILVTLADSWSRSWDDGRSWQTLPDAQEYRSRLRTDYRGYVEALTAAGARCVTFLVPPTAWVLQDGRFTTEDSFRNGAQAFIDDVVADLAAERPDVARVDYRSAYDGTPGAAPGADRPDGTHLSAAAAVTVAQEWFWPTFEQRFASGGCVDG